MERLLRDARYAIRLLLRAPGFTGIALLTLALGIGANTAIFSIVNGVVLRPLAYPRPEQLMYLTTQFPALGFLEFWVSPPEYLEFREINRSFADVGAFRTGEVNLAAADRPLRVRAALVDEHLLRALGLQPAQGRFFASGETDLAGPLPGPGPRAQVPKPIAILSHELWQSAFGGRPIVGQTIDVDGYRCEVIGIMPRGADLLDTRTEIWLPLGLNPANRQNRGNHSLYLVGRLKEGVSQQAAQVELASLIENWGDRVGLKQGSGTAGHLFVPLSQGNNGHILQMKPLQEEILGSAGRSIWALQAAVGFVLLIACANLANLLLARAESRHREMAVRTAIGASRWRLLLQFVTEGVLLSVAGGVVGVIVARVGIRALLAAYPTSLPRTSEVTVDVPVLLFTLGVSLATGVLVGLAPLMHTRIRGLAAALKDSGARGATSSAHRIRRALVVVEVALAVILVVGAGLLVRTVYNLTQVDAGFNRSRLVTFAITLPIATSEPRSRLQTYQNLLARLRAVPGVQGASAMTGLPPNRPLNANDTEIDNYTPPPGGPFENVDYYQNVMSDYFETMGIPIVQGRGFQAADAVSRGPVAVVNETLVNTFWKGLNPIGQRLRPCCGDSLPWFTVIGVAKDVKQGGVDQKTGTELYMFVDQSARGPLTMNFVMRTALPVATLSPTIQRAVSDADPAVPIVRFREMDDVFAESIRRPRLVAQLVGGFAALALLLAAIGTYGILSFMVTERRREIGIRLALGADHARVLVQVMTQGLALAGAGVAAGVAGALVLNRLIASLLFGVQPSDTATMGAVVGTIALVAVAACWLPAWRASRLNPNVVLHED